MRVSARRNKQGGFSLIETMMAIGILVVGILSLAAVLANAIEYMTTAQYNYIAQQKASEAIESIFSARDVGQATWNQICNAGAVAVCPSGIFLNGALPLCGPGNDGILGTADDYNGASCAGLAANAAPDAILFPNQGTGVYGATPVSVPLTNFKRTIAIGNVTAAGGGTVPNLRQITVTITYSAERFQNLTYTLSTYISSVP